MPGRWLNGVCVISAAFGLISLSGCGSGSSERSANASLSPPAPGASINQFVISGQNTFADGTPIASTAVQYQLILDGSSMFQAGFDSCKPTPAHVAATTIQNAKSDAQGGYSLKIPIGEMYAAVVRQCTLQQLHTSQITGLTLKASILATKESCSVYCSAQGSPSESCVNDCATGNRTIGASESIVAEDAVKLLSHGTLSWDLPLNFSELGPALNAGAGPDLVVDADAAQSSAHISQESFDAGSCEIADQCVRAPGSRTVLRFDGTIRNLGSSDLVIGNPQKNPLFQASNCHKVPLLKNIMVYELVDPATNQIVTVDNQQVVGRKQGFCMMDISQVNGSAPQGKYDCDNQGISVGWADVYDSDLDCQFLDVTGVPPGQYTLRLTVNPDGLFQESDTSNNTIAVPVTIPDSSQ